MKSISTLSKLFLMILSVTGVSTAALAVIQPTAANTNVNAKMTDAAAVVQSKISLQQAILMASKTVQGDVVGAEYDQHDHMAGGKYEVKLIGNGVEHEVNIDANTGKVLKTKQEKLDTDDMAEYSAMKQSKMTLTQAIQKATQTVNGKVLEAEFDIDNGKSVYEVKIANGTQVNKIAIDSMTGQVISNQVKAAHK